ncbi:hypothetical protein J6590_045592, partial [Homalodisca vitripennis]
FCSKASSWVTRTSKHKNRWIAQLADLHSESGVSATQAPGAVPVGIVFSGSLR